MNEEWYVIRDIDSLDTPALVIYRERVAENICTLKAMIDDVTRLRPHVKTSKAAEPIQLLIKSGISKFKCATIAEAEMLAMAGAADVLLSYQPVGPKIIRLIELIKKFPAIKYSCLVDNVAVAEQISDAAVREDLKVTIYIDLNVGMNRTGIIPGEAASELYKSSATMKGLVPAGLHVYDGHIRDTDFIQRAKECDDAFEAVFEMRDSLQKAGFKDLIIVAGGSPTFPVHAKRKDIECSPGTFIYWDRGYQLAFPEQRFEPAALVLTRVISLPSDGKICVDLGHKSVAAENILDKRVHFLNAPHLQPVSQSEEHLVMEATSAHTFKVGDVLYGLPYHICPTVALYERATIIQNNRRIDEWGIIARDRKINI